MRMLALSIPIPKAAAAIVRSDCYTVWVRLETNHAERERGEEKLWTAGEGKSGAPTDVTPVMHGWRFNKLSPRPFLRTAPEGERGPGVPWVKKRRNRLAGWSTSTLSLATKPFREVRGARRPKKNLLAGS